MDELSKNIFITAYAKAHKITTEQARALPFSKIQEEIMHISNSEKLPSSFIECTSIIINYSLYFVNYERYQSEVMGVM
jgi:hypothetical protein